MKRTILLVVLLLSGCGTVGGTISGMGQDLSKLGGWIKDK